MSIIGKIRKLLAGTAVSGDRPLAQLSERDLINAESAIGRQLFGAIPDGHRREFFCLDEHTWIWHEEWAEDGQTKLQTTRYDVRPTGVKKSTGGGRYVDVAGTELDNLLLAMRVYYEQVMRGVYNLDSQR
jgi:hypothetical protein